jgi:hypothetical protein
LANIDAHKGVGVATRSEVGIVSATDLDPNPLQWMDPHPIRRLAGLVNERLIEIDRLDIRLGKIDSALGVWLLAGWFRLSGWSIWVRCTVCGCAYIVLLATLGTFVRGWIGLPLFFGRLPSFIRILGIWGWWSSLARLGSRRSAAGILGGRCVAIGRTLCSGVDWDEVVRVLQVGVLLGWVSGWLRNFRALGIGTGRCAATALF